MPVGKGTLYKGKQINTDYAFIKGKMKRIEKAIGLLFIILYYIIFISETTTLDKHQIKIKIQMYSILAGRHILKVNTYFMNPTPLLTKQESRTLLV